MLTELAGILVGGGILLLLVGGFVSRQYTLRAKLLTAFLVIVLASLGILALLDNHLFRSTLMHDAEKRLEKTALGLVERIDYFNRRNRDFILADARHPAIAGFLGSQPVSNRQRRSVHSILLALQARQSSAVVSYAIVDREGNRRLDTRMPADGSRENGEHYFRQILSGKDFYRSPVLFEQNDPYFVLAAAIRNSEGRIIGILRAKYDAAIYAYMLKEARRGIEYDQLVMLFDENAMRLFHSRRPDLNLTLARPLSDERKKQLQAMRRIPASLDRSLPEDASLVDDLTRRDNRHSRVIQGSFSGQGEVDHLAMIVPLQTVPWKLVVARPLTHILEPARAQQDTAYLLVCIIVLVVTVIVWVTTHFLLGPVRRLTRVVRQIAEGDLAVQARVEADDEIGHLAQAFNEMTHSVADLIDDLGDEINSHKLTADRLRKLSQAIEQSPVSVMITDLDGTIEYVNPQLCKLTGYSEAELIGRKPSLFKSSKTPEIHFKKLWDAITHGRSWSGELYNRKKNGEFFWESVTISPIKNQRGVVTHYLAIKEDISLRKDYEDRLLYQASYDRLTGLPNRVLAYDRISQAIANAVRASRQLALLYMDFDHFKNINDTLGHSAGDDFLRYMAGRLKSCVREFETVARLGGDEFLIMLIESDDDQGDCQNAYIDCIKQRAAGILDHISRPCRIHEMEFSVTASVGIAIFPNDGNDPHVLLKSADTAMYRAKRKGRNCYEAFTSEMGDRVMQRVEIENRLRGALEQGQFHLMYQPLLDATSRKIVGAEALIRWHDETLGNVSPEMFVPLAEETGFIVEIGNWVLDQACRDIRHWRQISNNRHLYMAVNLSTRQFRGKDIVNSIAAILEKNQLTGDCLELEITERLLMKDVPHVLTILEQFKEMGIRLSVDDFGTGYSSLSYLKRFPFDVLKIDKAFIDDIGTDPDGQALCDAIVAMAHSLGLGIIGEGVENRQQFEFLRDRGAETIQGYFVSKPLTGEEFVRFLQKENALTLSIGDEAKNDETKSAFLSTDERR